MSVKYDYDVALSFAGEDRVYVEKVADILRNEKIKVFYDGFEAVNLWGKNLYTYLSDIYCHKANYTVIFISKFYAEKLWTSHERQNAQARAFKENGEYILPARFDDTPIQGISDTISYIDLTHNSPEQFALLICAKVRAIYNDKSLEVKSDVFTESIEKSGLVNVPTQKQGLNFDENFCSIMNAFVDAANNTFARYKGKFKRLTGTDTKVFDINFVCDYPVAIFENLENTFLRIDFYIGDDNAEAIKIYKSMLQRSKCFVQFLDKGADFSRIKYFKKIADDGTEIGVTFLVARDAETNKEHASILIYKYYK